MQTPGILILAAGLGSRFRQAGGTGHKLLAPYPDDNGVPQPLLKLTLQQAQRSGLPLLLIIRPEDRAIQQLAQQYGVATCTIASAGSGESIAAGVRATAHWHGWLIVPGDMAWVRAEDHQCVAQALRNGAPQVRLSWQNQPGHPVGFAAHYGAALAQLQGDSGARALLDPAILITLPAHQGTIRDADLPRSDASH
ncbi:nucleotidyltransferase family protein [Pantoea dispersa]|uniref:nucleotidyltransferase family protein n=1 Tax=Pantoea dispersa TaxID=59814 RepID=UPI0021C8DE4E|nr:NTP transferase domain-containing protein [Pantoea dispersa]